MRVLLVGTDRSYFNEASAGDAVARHLEYSRLVGGIDIIVVGRGKVKFKGVSPHLNVYLTNTFKLFHYWGVIKIAKKLFLQNRYDLIVAQDLTSPAGLQLKKKYGTALIVSVHSMFFNKGLFSFNLINQWGVSKIKKTIRNSDGVRVNNEVIKDEIVKWGVTAPVLVQPTPVNIEKFIVEQKEHNEAPTILYVGRLTAEKNVEMLLRSLLAMKTDFKATIVGDGPEKKKLEEIAQGEKRIQFAGPQAYENLPQYYKKADIFVLPSNSESFGKVLIEAAASQCAIVATRTAGAESILTHEKDALLIPVGDKKALQMAVESLCSNLGRQKALGEQALETARKYSFEESSKRIVQFWKEVANSKSIK